jgi:Fe-S-cluster containining protein
MNELDQHRYFFDSGIRFQCQRCGACCTGAPGVIRVSDEEAMAIADFLDQPVQEAIDALLYPWENGYSIREDDDGRCLFYDEGCRIYPVRPRQCRTFPFWTAILRSQDRWDSVRRSCPGVGKGRLFAKHEILDILNS